MTIDASAPDRAAKRTDLPFLRRRSRMTQPSRPAHSAMAEFVGGHATARAHPTATSASTSLDRADPSVPSHDLGSSLDLSAPQHVATPWHGAAASSSVGSAGADTSLDLSAPEPPPASRRAASAPSADTSLDLSALARPTASGRAQAAAHPSPSTSLDLGSVPIASTTPVPAAPDRSTSLDLTWVPPTPSPAARPLGSARTPTVATAGRIPVVWPEPRTSHGVPTILNVRSPTVTLTRVQSGVGALTFEAVAAPGVGDLRLGSAYQLRSGRSSTLQHHAGRRFAPPGETRRPLLLAARGQFERISLDLRQVTDLERCVVYGFSGDGRELRWGGTLVVTTFGGDRIEMPMEMVPSTAVAVLGSVYNIGGQLVLRSEMDLIGRTIREACRGYGFDRITWLDDVTPVD